ncbi:MAG: hypothetical protein HYS21_09565 [Deltaproteobacteria bacterium]|nr:hypothetical protein [Deltaproteobacteria bacterium]
MSDEFKICPECGAEYFPHAIECRTCEIALVFASELEKKKQAQPQAAGSLVCIEEGTLERVSDLANALGSIGFEASVYKMGQGSSCGGGFGLFVDQAIARSAVKELETIWQRLYPELKESEKRLEAGLCPACGSNVKESDTECPDCGLNLFADPGGFDSCGGGGCGSGCS